VLECIEKQILLDQNEKKDSAQGFTGGAHHSRSVDDELMAEERNTNPNLIPSYFCGSLFHLQNIPFTMSN